MRPQTLTRSIPTPLAQLHLPALLVCLALGGAVLHAALNGQYGFHRDELDILMNARQLAWGYVAYPPFTPAVARLGLAVFGPSLIGLRVFSAIAQGVVMLPAGLMARDFGGGRAAQVMAALAAYIAPVALFAGTVIQYMAFDYLWWVLTAFCLVRLLKTDNPRWWLGIGAALGLGMLTKFTIAFWAAGLAAGVLLTSARRDLRSPWLWAGAALALLIYSPNLVWQIQHGFITLNFLSAIHARDIQWGRTDGFLIDQFYVTNNPLTLPLWVAGLAFCFVSPAGRRFRALGWMFLATFGIGLVTRSRGYYTGPAYVMLIAAGAAGWERWLRQRSPSWRRAGQAALWVLVGIGALVGIVLAKPIVPINSPLWPITSGINKDVVEMIGWPDLAEQVAAIYARIPVGERPQTAILAGNYGEAGAFDLYGPALGLPRLISGSNSLWARGFGEPPQTVIVVGFERPYAERFFSDCQPAGHVTNAYGVKNEETTFHTGLYVCRGPRRPWSQMWPELQWFQ